MTVDVVIPSARPELAARVVERLDGFPGRVIVVDGRGRSPAAARNAGWRASTADWVAFLDDDVVPAPGWAELLLADLGELGPDAAGSQGVVVVPREPGRAPTDWERCVQGLEGARWATADMAYRREALERLGGFDERFPRAYREDADLALRALRSGWRLWCGRRVVVHPVREAGPLVSLRRQAGNADDALMRAKHGPRWRAEVGAPPGRLHRHVLVTAAGAAALAGLVTRRRALAATGLAGWLAGTAELARARIAPGPRTPRELATMVATSVALPPLATAWALAGRARWSRLALGSRRTRAVLFDRDGTLVENVPYNGDPERVRLLPGAREAVERARAAGLAVGVVTNQSGMATGLLDPGSVGAVNARVAELAGPIDEWLVCPHGVADGCECRKPKPGLVLRAAAALGVRPEQCVVIGDIGSDVDAARAAGARGILVPTSQTLRREVEEAPVVAPDLCTAVDLVLRGAA